MLVFGLFVPLLVAVAALIVYMATHGEHDIVESVEREVAKIRWESAQGWSTQRILRHHRSFCACQIDHLRRGSRV